MTQARSGPPAFVFGLMLVFGLILTAVLGYGFIWLPLRVNLFYQQTDCVVLDKRLEESQSTDPDDHRVHTLYRPLIYIKYAAGGRPRQVWTYDATGASTSWYGANQAILDRFQKGQRYPCWYDPDHPDSAVLTRSFSLLSLMALTPLIIAVIGAAGLIHSFRARGSAPNEPLVPTPTYREGGFPLGFLALFIGGFFVAGAISFLWLNSAGAGRPTGLNHALFFGPFVVYGVIVFVFGVPMLKKDFHAWAAGVKRAMPSPERAAAPLKARQARTVPDKPSPVVGEARYKRAMPSPERAAAPLKARRARIVLDKTSPVADMEDDVWPNMPSLTSLAAGEELAYRLACSSSSGDLLLAIAVCWNGIVFTLVNSVIHDYRNFQPNWLLMLFLVPFVLIGLFLMIAVLLCLVDFLISLPAGSLRVEIAKHPLHPGSSVGILVKQSGLVPLRNVRVTLRCREWTRYTQGTDTRTDTKEVVNIDVLGPEPSLDGGLLGTLKVPGDAMYSFKAPHNKITWTLAIDGQTLHNLPCRDEYPIIVRPASGGVRP
jgi:hypothetical protein